MSYPQVLHSEKITLYPHFTPAFHTYPWGCVLKGTMTLFIQFTLGRLVWGWTAELTLLPVIEGKEFWSGSCWLYSATLHWMICASISLSRCIWFYHHHHFLMGNKTPSYRVCKGRRVALYESINLCLHTAHRIHICYVHVFHMCHPTPWYDVSLTSATSRTF